MEALGAADLAELTEELRAEVRERGVRYGETGPGEFVVDAVPRLFTKAEWDELARGLSQRIRALDAFLRDAYGERRIVEAGGGAAPAVQAPPRFEAAPHGGPARPRAGRS